ncbi:putative nadh-ubiquinone oxidoreductase 105 kda subunit [Phaeomoniella chlamydospora]|uniref:Putative nadh-ubiquinone oxidoreductase 105 kDa subunit n=1 Tax=Phaeomoniella chlamydospora TaxID=158046 RepID=A0A0G2DXB9_PHACM|nr:putative nadh-ubiquinone oxidoreductase 105 kda subunit [Phaeomoniella chlamydospora]
MSGKYAFAKGIRELRFHFCHTSNASDAMRTFLKRAYPTMKKNNPYIPIMMREAQDVEPRIWARYGYGKEKSEPLSGLTDKEIEEKVTTLVKSEL